MFFRRPDPRRGTSVAELTGQSAGATLTVVCEVSCITRFHSGRANTPAEIQIAQHAWFAARIT